jgi:hypothetical protein
VARLALQYAAAKSLAHDDVRTIFVAALLHDIGHAPFSHSIEPVFEKEFGITHHRASEEIILGRVPLGESINSVLRSHAVDIQRVLAVMNGEEPGFDGFFAGPINFDTIEGITRSLTYRRTASYLSDPAVVVDAATRRLTIEDRQLVDSFWQQKGQAYKYIIGSSLGVLADFACQHFFRMNRQRLSPADYFITEEAMFRKLPGLHRLLTSRSFEVDVSKLLLGPLPFVVRRFFVNDEGDFFIRDDKRRYQQTREKRVLHPKDIRQEQRSGDLFNGIFNSTGEGIFRG